MIINIIAMTFMITGFFFVAVAVLGVLRLPDFYTRLHASGKSETLGLMLTLMGLAIYNGLTLVSFKILLVSLFILLGNPIGTHAIARAAYYSGLKPWTKEEK